MVVSTTDSTDILSPANGMYATCIDNTVCITLYADDYVDAMSFYAEDSADEPESE